MEAVILAGGLGARLREEARLRPKAMVEIGAQSIRRHPMKFDSRHGIDDFVVCPGSMGYLVIEDFANRVLARFEASFDLRNRRIVVDRQHSEPRSVTPVDTGEMTEAGGSLRRVAPHARGEDVCSTCWCASGADGTSRCRVGDQRRADRLMEDGVFVGTRPGLDEERLDSIAHTSRKALGR